ncbi:B-cell receptor CD22-like [Haliotis cracherodii]|uniref:B-cell receptor CD22-like n=1 Tax=Haliotis cracherodii TaxID=6455 RepID=UPI0039E82579
MAQLHLYRSILLIETNIISYGGFEVSGNVMNGQSAPVLTTNRRVPVEGVSFSITCTLDAAISGTARFYKGIKFIQGGCTSSGSCSTPVSGYSVSLDSASRILTLDISSPDSVRDSGTWRCIDGTNKVSNIITLSQFAAVLDWSSVTFSPQLTSLPSSVTPQNTISVTVTTPCAAPAAVITWRYQHGVSGVPPSSTSSSQGSCPSGQDQTTSTLSLPGNTASLYNRQVSLTVSVEHDSFDPPTYTKSVTSNTIQFPVPVTSVTLTNINSDNEEIGQAVGQPLTMTCVTSASFPTSSVTWVTLPPGTTPTVSTETTSGVLVKTTSSVTFTFSKTDQGRSIHCRAENINGQTFPQSNRATLEGWFGPEQVEVTMPDKSVVFENKDLTLTCTTTAYPNLTFIWDYSDGTPVGGNTGSVSRSSTWWSQTRTFKPNKDKTAVRCQVRNTRTSTTQTGSVSLDVKYPPPVPPSITNFQTLMFEGDPETISCSVTGGNPLATITWSCPGTGPASVSISGQTRTSTLSFTVSRSQNSQQCQCLGEWQYGTYNLSDVRTFSVSYPPDKPNITNPGTLCEGKSTSLTCSSSPDHGNPPATFYWTKNNEAVHTGSSYTFSPVKADNGADIKCAAGNAYTDTPGSSRPQSDARQLSVYYVGLPTITPAATQTKKEEQSLSLTCSADGNPDNAVITWTFNDSPVQGSSVMKADLNRSDDGEYVCTGRVNTGSVCPGGSLQWRSTVRVIVNCNPGVSGLSLGTGLGVGLGICIIVIIVMGAALFYLRRRHQLSTHDRGKPAAQMQDRDIREQPIGNTQNSDTQDLSQYARFEECASQPYFQLKIYENTKGRVPHEPVYEGLQERSPTTYEAVALHTYENMDRKVKDQTYANTSTTG